MGYNSILDRLVEKYPNAEGIDDARNIAEAVAAINGVGGRGANAIADQFPAIEDDDSDSDADDDDDDGDDGTTPSVVTITWVPGNLEDDGSIVPYDNRYTTEEYLIYDTDMALSSANAMVLCTYDAGHDVVSRSVIQASTETTIEQGTIFRVTVTNVSSSEAAELAVSIEPIANESIVDP